MAKGERYKQPVALAVYSLHFLFKGLTHYQQ